ncbi:MAG TPA: YheV family putative zinc ribbon protein [Pseudomonadales bacterium]|nr:YheV family putative zinc ribbon protein [Pseudomonadales bacterium]
MTQPVKRFIAGAVCPKCATMDTVRAYEQDGNLYRECVVCDFNDAMDAQNGPAKELPTRVNQSDKLVLDEGEKVIRLLN